MPQPATTPTGTRASRLLAAWCAVALLGACGADDPPAASGPNVVVILVDDLGWADAGTGASAAPKTPRIDALLADSARPRTYRTAPMCTPARAGLLTGVEPAKLGMLRNLGAREGGGLPPEATTLAERFRSAGWSTALVGKWHLGHSRPGSRPNAQGFERFRGFLGGWIEPTTRKRGAEADWWRDESPVEQQGYAPAMLLEEARRAILERPRGKPFFLWFATPLPHAPLHAPPGAVLPENLPEGAELNRAAMRSMVEELDRHVGVLLDLLAAEGLERETVVVFASDNGGDRDLGADNGGLRAGKYTPWEGGLRTRFALRLPGRVAAGERDCDISYLDLAPTLCSMAGIAADSREFDGLDTSATWLRGAQLAPRMLRYACERSDERRVAVVEDGRKLVRIVSKSGAKSTTLHDLRADPGEAGELYPADDARSARWIEAARELEGWR
jgi:arylsulfatase A-like enzyme